jgi:hypothetical protein
MIIDHTITKMPPLELPSLPDELVEELDDEEDGGLLMFHDEVNLLSLTKTDRNCPIQRFS